MSRRSAEPNGRARVAVVGAPTEEGARLREALAEVGVPGARVDLYALSGEETVLSEYAGEARMIQRPDLDEIAGHDLIFLCEPGRAAADVAAAASDAVVIDLLDCLSAEAAPRRVHMDINPDAAQESGARFFAVPHPLTLILAGLLHPLHRALGLAEVTAVVIRPASDFGREGVEELREQTVRLLSFADVPVGTFGRQLAFNVIPQVELASRQGDVAARVHREVTELLGWPENRFAVRWIAAPMFHGHGLQLRFRLERESDLETVRGVLADAGLDPAPDARATPLDVSGEARTSLSDLAEDGIGGYWLWVVAGEIGATGARHAVRLAAELGL